MSEQLIQTPGVFGDNGNFLLERELGTGGMGGVYMGRDKMLDRPVAVKVMLKEFGSDAEFIEKFKKEAQAAARLIHPNIVQVYSYGISDGMPYMALELAAGGSLYSLMNANPGKTDIQRVLKICQQTALALQCASDQGVVHGDVKPENILLDANGNAKLVDFGLAAMQKNTEEIWGTPYYISPEKVRKENVDFRADMYSLGCTLYHALTGVAPFEGQDSSAVVKKRFEGAPRKPSAVRPEITPAIDALVMTMIEFDKEKRYPSFEALVRAFSDVLTVGLTQRGERPAGISSPANSAPKRTTVHTRRMVLKKMQGATDSEKSKHSDVEAQEDEDVANENLGLKVALFAVGGVLAIGLVLGSVWWYKSSAESSNAARASEEAQKAVGAVQQTIDQNREAMERLIESNVNKCTTMANQCEKFTGEMKELLPDFAEELVPAVPDALVKARASTNAAPAAVAAPEDAAAAKTETKVSAEPVKKQLTYREEAIKYNIDPPPDDFDPASPDAQEFLAKLKEAREKAKAAEEEAKTSAQAEVADAATPAAEKKQLPLEIKDIHELWARCYKAELALFKLKAEADKFYALCDKSKEKLGGSLSEKDLDDIKNAIADGYSTIKNSKMIDEIAKANIQQNCKKIKDRLVKRLTAEKERAAKEAKLAAQEAAKKEAAEKREAEKKATAEREAAEIAAKFDQFVGAKWFRVLRWDQALSDLQKAAKDYVSAEGQQAMRLQMRKVNQMKLLQTTLSASMVKNSFMFDKSKITFGARGQKRLSGKVVAADSEKFIVQSASGDKRKVTWATLYKSYPDDLVYAISKLIFPKRGENAGLSLNDWKECMCGVTLTMRYACECADDTLVGQKWLEEADKPAKQVVKEVPDFENSVHEVFPDMTFETTED